VSCLAGYTNQGTGGYTCEADGNEVKGTWTGTETCVEKVCPTAVNPTGGTKVNTREVVSHLHPVLTRVSAASADAQVKTECSGSFQANCPTLCYDGYCPLVSGCPDEAVTYTCADKVGSTAGQWLPGNDGVPSGKSDSRKCTGIPCDSAPPESNAGTSVADATTCAKALHYNRDTPIECGHGKINGALSATLGALFG
jgi:hypothetical protein